MQAEVWLLELDETPGAAFAAGLDTTVLDARERERAASFVRAVDRALYTAAHVALRTVLGGLLGERPQDLNFTREPCPCCGAPHGRPALAVPGATHGRPALAVPGPAHGRPALPVPGATNGRPALAVPDPAPGPHALAEAGPTPTHPALPVPGGDASVPPPPLHFSLSHTRGMVLIATAPVPVGADVELRPAPETVADLVSVLHLRERADIEAEEEPARRAAVFGRIWARKEAYLKGLGTGLGRDTTLDDLGGDGTGAGSADERRHPADWTLHDLPCGPAHHGAVALRSPRAATEPPVLHRLTPEALRGGTLTA
ncbi:4'-phosphopantetheinyl transferase superfamily protein [Streptomyces sp. NPDC006339]|uniref:4'-phosphopantetheinyl transferase family protein n=1 Tax=Streptomyces sp. NPDC006339 TaxID=3156755 RepID=UPI0033A834B5